MLVVFVHGWSVAHTNTYGGLPSALAMNSPSKLPIEVGHLQLSRYVSFADEVTAEDLARGMQNAVRAEIVPKLGKGERFACVTHSTGGPIARKWIDLYYKGRLDKCPMQHLVMLAPANHGSALAQLGKGRLSRMKFFTEGVQPGAGVLDWLELGSDQSWELNSSWLDYDCLAADMYLFVLTGQSIDRHLYDNLNSYTGEAGSDGVVRVAAANMNYGLIRLVQERGTLSLRKDRHTQPTALGVLPGLSHSGTDMGIMGSVRPDDNGTHPTVQWLLKCLSVDTPRAYRALLKDLQALTQATQDLEHRQRSKQVFAIQRTFVTSRYCMCVFRVVDDRGNPLNDYDVVFTAGPTYDENHLPPGFFKDRQRNSSDAGKLTYLIDYDVLSSGLASGALKGKLGIRVAARPDHGFAHYSVAEYQGTFDALKHYVEPNQTVMIEIELKRRVGIGVFQLTQDLAPHDFRHQERGEDLDT